jgi:hypothetical protein
MAYSPQITQMAQRQEMQEWNVSPSTQEGKEMTERRREVGACGVYCGGCLDFRCLAENNEELRRQAATVINRETNRNLRPDQVGCEGCWGGIHNAWTASPECKIRRCAEAKGFATCADCSVFPCEPYSKQFGENSDNANHIRGIQKVGLATWLAGKQIC